MSSAEEAKKEGAKRQSDLSNSMTVVSKTRPSRLSFEGYVFNANMVLEHALDPQTREVPVELVKECKGVVVCTIVHVGAVLTFYYGTGVCMKKTDEGWSAPSAVSVGGTSMGAVVGGKRDNCIIFIMDDENMNDFVERPQTRLGFDAALAAGNIGGDAAIGMDAPKKGTVTFVYSLGAFAGLALQMSTLQNEPEQNAVFYGKEKIQPKEIVSGKTDDGSAVEIPSDSQIPDLHKKMDLLLKGETWLPSDDDLKRSGRFASVALEQSQHFVSERSGTNA